MKFIELTNATVFASVNDDDYEKIKLLDTKWMNCGGDTVTSTRRLNNGKHILLSRFLLGVEKTTYPYVDHINRDRFCFLRDNLRLATASQNNINAKKSSNNTSGYIGVSYLKAAKRWQYRISYKGRRISSSVFDTAEAAAKERDKIAKKLYGKFVTLNFPDTEVLNVS